MMVLGLNGVQVIYQSRNKYKLNQASLFPINYTKTTVLFFYPQKNKQLKNNSLHLKKQVKITNFT